MQLWTDVFRRDLEEGFEPDVPSSYIKPGVLVFRGWGLERQLSGDRRQHVEALRATSRRCEKTLPPKYAYVHGVRDVEKPANLKLDMRGNPMRLGDEVPRRFLTVLSDGEPAPFAKGSGRLELAETIAQAAARRARHRQSHLERPLRHRHRRHAEQLRPERRAADASRAARVPGAVGSSRTACRSRSCTARSC